MAKTKTVRDMIQHMLPGAFLKNKPTKWGYIWVERLSRPRVIYRVAVASIHEVDSNPDFSPWDRSYPRFVLDKDLNLIEGSRVGAKIWNEILVTEVFDTPRPQISDNYAYLRYDNVDILFENHHYVPFSDGYDRDDEEECPFDGERYYDGDFNY